MSGRLRLGLRLVAVGGALVVVAGCTNSVTVGTTSSTGAGSTSTTGPSVSTTSAPAPSGPVARVDAAGTVWLCRPGISANPCLANPSWTAVGASGSRAVHEASAGVGKRVDCFYVYPTVSTEAGPNADLRVQTSEIGAAVEQASRFSADCNVWAPMYRQRTVASLSRGLAAGRLAASVAYASLLHGWEDYLQHFNDGRPIVFIGHSQGAAILIQLLRQQVDSDPALRRRVVAAVILGGNVDVPTGKLMGGSFQHIPVCTSAKQFGCVIAYSSFPSEPPANSLFGRPGQGVSTQWGETATAASGLSVVCVNPAALADSAGASAAEDLEPYFYSVVPPVSGVTTRWVEYPKLYRGQCETASGASWLNVTPISATDPRPKISEVLGPTWGYHLDDVNVDLGDLVSDIASMEHAFEAAKG